jgi:hypothetical protein
VIKNREFNQEGLIKGLEKCFQKGGGGSFCSETFYDDYKNLKFNTNAKFERKATSVEHLKGVLGLTRLKRSYKGQTI